MTEETRELTDQDLAHAMPHRQRQRILQGIIEGGEDVVAIRNFVRMTQQDFATALGISVHTLRNWEQNRRRPEGPAIALLRIAARHPRVLKENLYSGVPVLDLVKHNREKIEVLCRRFRVRRLELFGSATSGTFDPEISDLDFSVEFLDFPEGGIADAYFGLREGLRELFRREVDLVTVRAVTNPYLKKSIERSKELLYTA